MLQYIRQFSSKSEQKLESFHDKPDPHLIKYDYIGPPDKESNLRPYVRCLPENESGFALLLRTKRIEVEEWNQSFWSKHNKRFYEVSRIYAPNSAADINLNSRGMYTR